MKTWHLQLSAVSRMAAATGDETFTEKGNTMVSVLSQCQRAINQDGYLAAFPSGAFDRLEGKRASSGGVVVPYYIIHKIMAGLLDASHYLHNAQALEVAVKMADYFEIPAVDVPPIVSASSDPADWLESIGGEPLAFRVHNAGSANGIVFRRLYELHHQRYSVYWRIGKSR
jgi:hypothetical protein